MSTTFSDAPAMPWTMVDVPPTDWTIADVLARLPEFPAERIHTHPSPGTATEADVLEMKARGNRICELIDGTLVEKAMATYESILAAVLIGVFQRYLDENNLGVVAGGDGMLKILPGQIRTPDVSFISWERLPSSQLPRPRVYALAPDLAVEILSEGNTATEMDRKLHDYFQSGVRLVWYIDPASRTAKTYTGEHDRTEIGADGLLSGGEVLPGFKLPLAQLFARVERPK
jgi:Uma2 family endonuclease